MYGFYLFIAFIVELLFDCLCCYVQHLGSALIVLKCFINKVVFFFFDQQGKKVMITRLQ